MNAIVRTKGPLLPARITLRKLKQICDELDWIAEQYDKIVKATRDVYPHCPTEWLERAERIAMWPIVPEKVCAEVDTLDGAMMDDDCVLHDEVIGLALAELVACYPNAKPDPAFVPLAMEEISAAEPTYCQLQTALIGLRRTNKFLPNVPEIVQALEHEGKVWARRMRAVDNGESARQSLIKKIEHARAKTPVALLPKPRKGDADWPFGPNAERAP